jgi:hypothetical protein
MESITLIKSALRLSNKALAQRKRKGEPKKRKRADRDKKKRSFWSRAILVVAVFAGIYLLAAVASSANGSSAHTTQSKLPANTETSLRSYSAAISVGQKDLTLQSSSAAALTAYPDSTSNALSSATIDQQTDKIAYTSYTGKGGVLKTTIANDSCPQPLPGKLLNYISFGAFNAAVCNGINQDLLTSTQNGSLGWLFNIPTALTTNCAEVHNILIAVEGAAWLALVPIIMLLGFSVMAKWSGAGYADAVQQLPTLVLTAVGIAMCWFIVGQIVDFGNTLMQGLWYEISNAGISIGDVTDFVMPAGVWEEWLVYLAVLLISMFVIQALAPAAVLGNVYGSFIVLAIDATLAGLLLGDAPRFVLLGFSMALGAEIVVRIVLIDFYIILSPLVMLAFIIPGQSGVGFARDWILGFLSLIASQLAQVVVLGVGMLVLAEYETHLVKLDIMVDIIKFATLGLMLRVPSLFKSNAVDLIKQVGPMVASGVQHEVSVFS